MFLLDTNACIAILNGTPRSVSDRLRAFEPQDIRLCSVVKAELIYGAHKSSRAAQNLRHLDRLFASFISLPFDDACAQRCGAIREELERRGRPIGPNDLLIAATAVTHDLELVTHNLVEFSNVLGLRVVDWETDA